MSLVVWLPLNNNLENLGVSSYNITAINTPTYVAGKIGQCYQRANSSTQSTNGINIDNNLVDVLGTQASIAVWIKPLGTHTHYNATIVGSGDWNADKLWNFGVSGDNSGVDVLCGGYNKFINCSIPVNEWTHIVSTFNNGICKLYKNGVYIGEKTGQDALRSNYSNTCIGRDTAHSGFFGFNGCINDVRIYNHCLSAAEVKEIAQGLVLHYKLDQNFSLTDIITGQDTYNVYNNYGVSASITNLSETYQGHVVRREIMTPTSANVSSFQSSLYAHGVYGHSRTFLANTKYVFWIYYRPVSHTDIRVGGTSSNIGGWIEIPPQSVGGGWYRVGQYRNGSVTSDKTDNIFTSFCTPTAAADTPITIDWAAPHLLAGTTEIPNYDFFMENEVIDSSGYGHNGTIIGDLISSSDTKRYSTSTRWNCSSPTDNSETGICYIQTPFSLTTPLQLTVAWWAKPESGYGGSTIHAAFCTSNNASRPIDYNTTALHHRDGGFDIYPSDGSGAKRLAFTYIQNEWHHYAITYDGTTAKAYRDGALKATITVGTNKTLATFSQLYIGYSQAGGVRRKTLGNYSDFRIYCTPLLDTDIRLLYNMGMRVDNLGGVHTFEFDENSSSSLKKQGILTNSHFSENGYQEILQYDKNIYTEPDGSTWIHIFHHNNPANGLFSSSTDWKQGIYLDSNRWYDIEKIISNLIQYEFMVKQKTTSDAVETKYRWIQNTNPLDAVYNDVKPGTCTYNTTSGYTNSSLGGLYILNSGTHFCIANNSSGNWYGAIGCWTAYQGGIPGYPNTTVTSGYIDLYARIYLPVKFIKNLGMNAIEFIEM